MLQMLIVFLFVGVIAVPDAEATDRSANVDRQALIATLERMIVTGEPHHSSHDGGELVQRAVEAALTEPDEELELLATRAAALLSAQVFRPVLAASEMVPLSIAARVALKLPHPVHYRAEVSVSVDGGEMVRLGYVDSEQETVDLASALPWTARQAGAHHLRLRALITFQALDGRSVPDPEHRDLPELVYAVYDPRQEPAADARVFQFSPAGMSAQHLDNRLPDMPFALWINSVLISRGGEPIDEYNWRIAFCDERTREPHLQYRRLDVCSVFHFQLAGTLGQIWIRTGRVELTDTSMQWLAGPPAFEAIRFMYSASSESYELSHLENLLDTTPDLWPVPDPSIAPRDIVIAPNRRRPNTARMSATIRNNGDADLYGLYVQVFAGDFDEPSTIRHFLRDIPRRGEVTIEVDVAYPRGYGIAVVQLMPSLTEYSPWITSGPDDPTTDDNSAFRAINPQRAPAGYVAAIKRRCGDKCRGY
jgi:hypothetical protein